MYIYILKSFKDNNYYVGISKDPNKRLKLHNNGQVFSTKYRRPLNIIYTEKQPDLLSARTKEKYLKSYKDSKEKLKLINKFDVGV